MLVETARAMFLRDGYAATSLEKVAEEAGFSKGAVYSNFDGKDDLCLAVLETIHHEVAEAVLGSLRGAATVEQALARSTSGPTRGSATPTGPRSRRSSPPVAVGTRGCAQPSGSATSGSAPSSPRRCARPARSTG